MPEVWQDFTKPEEEARRIEAARTGDLAAFNWLVLQHQSRVYNLCLRMLSDPDEAADATQEAFLSAYKAMSRFKGDGFRTWMLRIATNACLDMLRSKKRKPTQSLDSWGPANDTEDAGDTLPIPDLDPSINPEGSALRAETLAAIQEGLDTLPVDQRTALVLVDVQGLSYEETATITEANLGTVKSRVNRARGRMRDFLRERDILPSSGLSSGPPSGELSGRAQRL
ncbi:MAG TPA: sigma-70 family RNA polymerase sigma factor [Chloroflexia bacterium]|nr:sigma-70 family RNA polymerase sigma factor [Chloroflexia bacterium]